MMAEAPDNTGSFEAQMALQSCLKARISFKPEERHYGIEVETGSER